MICCPQISLLNQSFFEDNEGAFSEEEATNLKQVA